ncbi:MAG TPA: hypothetical protein VNZ01_04935 [Solirubrobacteraceae bacterium]|jgi:hypothetical protein|nr:hypothetical protein [Solirubrobacteraceae bacterium]
MSPVVELPPDCAPSAPPDAGVVRDARRRHALRRRRLAAAGAALMLVGLAAWLVGEGGAGSAGRHGSPAELRAFQRLKRERALIVPHISPALEGGSYGWCVIERGGGTCASLPTVTAGPGHHSVAIGAITGLNIFKAEERIGALLTSSVAGVLANGHPTRLLIQAQLPYGLRLAQIAFPRPLAPPMPVARAASTIPAPAPPTASTPTLLATSADRRPLGYLGLEARGFNQRIRWWEKPWPPPAGPCSLRARGLPSLEPQWGHVAEAIRPYPVKIIGRAFLSCVDTEYYLHGWPLETAILLDAQHPGSTPAPIPGMKSVRAAAGLFAAPGDWHGEITAARRGNAWLVVAGGSGLAQRIAVLRHLHTRFR